MRARGGLFITSHIGAEPRAPLPPHRALSWRSHRAEPLAEAAPSGRAANAARPAPTHAAPTQPARGRLALHLPRAALFSTRKIGKEKKKTTTTKANQPTKQAAARGKPVAGRAEGAAAAPRPTFPIPRPPSPPRAEAARTPGPQHSLDEVAGALLREALLPAAGQVCGDRERRGGERAARDPSGRGRARAASTHRSGSCVPS